MADNLDIKQPQDPTKINIHEAWELNYWAKKWNVSTDSIIAAVKVVGVYVDKVKVYLGK